MPKVHRFIPLSEVRSEARRHAGLGLQIGIDLTEPGLLFDTGWDKETRDLGRIFRGLGVSSVARGPGRDLPLGASDPYVRDHVRACHDRALSAALHAGCTHYLVRLGSLHGLPRSERLSRREASSRMIADLAVRARARGLALVVQHQLEPDIESLELILDTLGEAGAGLVFSPARALWAGIPNIEAFLERAGPLIQGVDLTDFSLHDLEPRAPGRGILGGWPDLTALLRRPQVALCVVDLPLVYTDDLVVALNELVRPQSAMVPA